MQYPPAISFSKISQQVQQLNLTRWLFVGGGLVYIAAFYRGTLGFWPGIGLIIIMIASTLFFTIAYRKILDIATQNEKQARIKLSQAFSLQALIDILLTILGMHITNGILSPLPILFIMYIGMSAVVLPGKAILIMNAAGAALFISLMAAYLHGILKPLPAPPGLEFSPPRLFVLILMVTYTLVMVLSGVLISIQARRIYKAWSEAEEKGAFLDRLNNLTRLSLTHTELNDLYQTIADHVGEVLGADSAHLTRWDEETRLAWPLAAYGLMRETYTQITPKPDERTLTRSLREAGKPLAVEDAQNSEYISREVVAEIPAQSLLGVPIYTYQENVFWGAVIISYNRQHHFNHEEIQRAQQVADIVALLITRACLYQETIVRAEMLREFSTHVTQLTSDLQHTSLLPAIVESSRSLMKAQRAALFLYNKELDQLTCAHAIALSKEYIKGIKKNYKDVPGGLILRGQLSVLVPDVNQDPHLKTMQNLIKREGFKAYAVFSLQSPDQELGALAVYWDQTHSITSEEVAIARLFAERAGALLHSALLYAQITELSQTDPLTNLPNRRALAVRLIDEANRTSRFEHSFTLIMLDLDGFKSINDTYGHSAGDNALKQIADAISRGLRGTDFISRYGGDEFALILPGTSKQTALTVTGKLRRTLESCDLDLPAGAQEHVSACMGLAGFPEDTNDSDKLIEISDRRLYRAKNIQAGTIIDSDL